MRIAVDLDGPIFNVYWANKNFDESGYRVNKFGTVVPGVHKAMLDMREAGHTLVIHTCRTNPEANWGRTRGYLRQLVRAALKEHGIPFDEVWTGIGKPLADVYIDDRGVRFKSWEQVLRDVPNLRRKK